VTGRRRLWLVRSGKSRLVRNAQEVEMTVETPKDLQGRRVALLVANEGVEQVELTEPRTALDRAGATTELLAPRGGSVQAFNHLDKADTFDVDAPVSSVGVGDFDALVLPGGVANADQLRLDPDAVAFVGEFLRRGKPVGVICHGPWAMVEADAVRGRTMTSWPSVQTDLRNAGANWVDEEVVTCEHGPGVIVSSRKPDDLPAFCREIVHQFATSGDVAAARK